MPTLPPRQRRPEALGFRDGGEHVRVETVEPAGEEGAVEVEGEQGEIPPRAVPCRDDGDLGAGVTDSRKPHDPSSFILWSPSCPGVLQLAGDRPSGALEQRPGTLEGLAWLGGQVGDDMDRSDAGLPEEFIGQ